MGRVHTSVVGDAHSYTRSKSPWILEDHRSVYGRLIHYLSGGGMRTFGRTVRQEEMLIRQRRFVAVASVLGVLWGVFYFI